MRIFGILDTVDNLNMDLFNNKLFYIVLLGALMFNYFYVIMFGGLTLLYNIITGFSMSSLVIGYFIHYAVPFEPEDFTKLTSELKDRVRDDASKMFKNLNIGWTTSITNDIASDEVISNINDQNDTNSESILDEESDGDKSEDLNTIDTILENNIDCANLTESDDPDTE